MVVLISYFTKVENKRIIRDGSAGERDIGTLPTTFKEFVTWLKKMVKDTYSNSLHIDEFNIHATMPGVTGYIKLSDHTYKDHARFKNITIELIKNEEYVHFSSDAVPMPLSDRVDAAPMPVHERADAVPMSTPSGIHIGLPSVISEECKSCFNERNVLISNIKKLLKTLKEIHDEIDGFNYYLKNDIESSGMTADEIETIIKSLTNEIQKHEKNLSSNALHLVSNASKVRECLKAHAGIYESKYSSEYNSLIIGIDDYFKKHQKTFTGGKLNIKKSKKTSKSKRTSKSKSKRTSKSKSKRTSKSKSKRTSKSKIQKNIKV